MVADSSWRRRSAPTDVDAIVLAGGRARRLGGEDKLVLPGPGGTPLGAVVQALSGVLGTSGTLVVVGWARDVVDGSTSSRVVWTREEPEFAGPFAAVIAGVEHCTSATVVVCAGDLPGLSPAAVATLVNARLDADADAAVYVDEAGMRQPLCSAYRLDWLRRRAAESPDRRDVAARALLDGASVVEVPDADAVTADVDTPEDVARWRAEGEPRAAGQTPSAGG